MFRFNKVTRTTPSSVFIVNFEQILHNNPVFLLLTLNTQIPAGTEPRQSILSVDWFLYEWNIDLECLNKGNEKCHVVKKIMAVMS